jgi:hypothetical protein
MCRRRVCSAMTNKQPDRETALGGRKRGKPIPGFLGHRQMPTPPDPIRQVRLFWTAPKEWPFCPGYTFLPATFDLIGERRFGDWSGEGSGSEGNSCDVCLGKAGQRVARAPGGDPVAIKPECWITEALWERLWIPIPM